MEFFYAEWVPLVAPAITVSQSGTLALTEGGSAETYTVQLGVLPAGNVTVRVSSGDVGAVNVNQAGGTAGAQQDLGFTTTTWNTAQAITLAAVEDDDGNDERVTITHAVVDAGSSDEYDPAPDVTFTATVADDDPRGVTLSGATLSVPETMTNTYTVVLDTQPVGGDVTVTAVSADGAVATVDPVGRPTRRAVIFTAGTWNTAQTVVVTGTDDPDAVDTDVQVTHEVEGADYGPAGVTAGAVDVTVTDDDTRGLTLDADPTTPATAEAGPLEVTEEHPTLGSAAYTVVLDTQPAGGAVTVTVASGNAAVAVDTDATPAERVLVFSETNWNTAQRVEATAVADDDNMVGESVTLTHTAVGGDYTATDPSPATLTVTVTDNDAAGLQVSVRRLTVGEGGAAATYTVRLNTAPTGGTVTVGISEPAPNPDVEVNPSALTFDADTWNTPQPVAVTGMADADAANDTTTLRHSVTGTGDATNYPTTLTAVDVAVTVDDAQTATVTLSAQALALEEDHATEASLTYTVVLDPVPTADVVVTLTTTPAGAVTVAPGVLTFTTTDFATPQEVTASALTDADAADARVTVAHTLTGAAEYAAVTVEPVEVAVTDDEDQAVLVDTDGTPSTQGALSVAEDDEETYTVQLGSAPTDPVVVEIGSDNADVYATPRLVQFTAGTWNTAQTVRVRADGDADARVDTATLTHQASGGDYTGETADVAVTVPDADAAVVISQRAVTAPQGGTNTYTVVLNTQPVGNVEVTVASGATATATVGPAGSPGSRTLTFGPTTWNTPQPVTVTGVAAGRTRLSHTVGGSGGIGTAAANVEVTVETTNVLVSGTNVALVVEPRFLEVLEGQTPPYTMRLAAQPAAGVTVVVGQLEPVGLVTNAISGITGGCSHFRRLPRRTNLWTFDRNNWNTPQMIGFRNSHRANYCAGAEDMSHKIGVNIPVTTTTGNSDGAPWQRLDGAPIRLVEVLDTIPMPPAPVATRTGRVGQGVNVVQLASSGPPAILTALNVWVGQEVNVQLGAGVQQARGGAIILDPHLRNLQREPATHPYEGVNWPLRYSLTPALPAGLTLDPTTRRLSGTPRMAAGTTTYTLTATDAPNPGEESGDANTVNGLRQFTLTVVGSPLLGFEWQAPAVRHLLNEAVAQVLPRLRVRAGTMPVLTFVVTPALPAGLRYVPPVRTAGGSYQNGGRIVGTPTQPTSSREYTLTAVDGDGNEAATTFALATASPFTPSAPDPEPDPAPDPEDRQPTFGTETVPAQVYRQGEAIAPLVLPAATDGDAPLSYTLTPALPAGLTYTAPADAASGGTLAGVPAAAQAATTYTLTATDADGDAATLAFTIAVEAVGPIRPQDGTRRYQRHGRQVTVTQAPGTPAGVEVTLPSTLARDVTITLTPPGDAVPLVRGRYGFGPAGAEVAVALTVAPVPADGLGVCLPVPAAVRTAAAGRAIVLVRYAGEAWATVAGATDDPAAGRICATEMTEFGPLAVGYVNGVPTFGTQTVPPQTYLVHEAIPPLGLPAATDGDAPVRYTLTPAALPAGLTYTPPADPPATGGVIAGTPTAGQAPTVYTLTATDADGDAATLEVSLEVVRIPVQVTIADATAVEGAAVEFAVTLSRAVSRALTVEWTAGRPGSATPGEDYPAAAAGRLTLAAGTTAGTLAVPTVDDRRVEPTETFTLTGTLPADPLIEGTDATAEGRIEDDDTERARRRSLGMVLAGVGRTLATDAVDVIGDRFIRQPSSHHVTVGGQALTLDRDPQTGRWRHAAGVAYGVARALGVEVGAPIEGGAGQFGQVRGAAWSTLTRHLRAPHAATAPLSAWDTPAAFAPSTGTGWGDPPAAEWGTPTHAGDASSFPLPSGRGPEPAPDVIRGGGFPAWGNGARPGLAGYGPGLGQGGFDRAHAATPQAMNVGTWRAPVQFRRLSGAEVLSQSEFEVPLRGPTPGAAAASPIDVTEADPGAPVQPVETAPQAEAAAWTLWGRGTASGFDGKPKADFSMDGDVFTGYLGLDYRLQPNVLLGLAVAHSQGDVDYETRDVTKGDVDVTLTSILPYAHWSPRPGLGVWGLFGAGWGDLQLRDEAGKVKTDLEMLMGAVGARQEVLTWRRIDVALKADAFLTELEAGADDKLPKTAGDAQRVRLMVEGRTAWAMSEESHLTPIFEIGGRWDGGKAETGVGAEMGGGVEYAHTKLGLGIEARGRYLLAHQKSAFDEWGASLTLKFDPGAAQRGLWLALAPVWGTEASQVEQMWGSADVLQAGADSATQPGLSPAQVEFDVGYGLVTYEGAGLLTTYGGLSMAGPQSHGYRLGGRIELGEWIDLSVEGERTTQAGGAEHQVALYGHLGW